MVRATEVTGSNTASVEDLEAQIATLRADVGNLTETLKGLGKAKTAQLASIASERADIVRNKGAEAAEVVASHAKDAQTQASAFVREQPATALGLAAGIGFLVGMISSRK